MNLNPKVTAGAVAAAVTLLIVFTLTQLGVDVPADVASALTLVLSVVAAYLKSSNDWSPR